MPLRFKGLTEGLNTSMSEGIQNTRTQLCHTHSRCPQKKYTGTL